MVLNRKLSWGKLYLWGRISYSDINLVFCYSCAALKLFSFTCCLEADMKKLQVGLQAGCFIGLMLILIAGCGDSEEPVKVQLSLYHSHGLGISDNWGVEQIRVTIHQSDEETTKIVFSQDFESTKGSGTINGLPYGNGFMILVEGLDNMGNSIMSGGSRLFDVDEQTQYSDVPIFITQKENFTETSAIGPDGVKTSLFELGPRVGHKLVPLDDERILIIGGAEIIQDGSGIDGTEINLVKNSLEIYDPMHGSFIQLSATLKEPRAFHTATRLSNGSILITGGITQTQESDSPNLETLSTSELIEVDLTLPMEDIVTVRETNNPMNEPRAYHTATLRSDGTVILIGGKNREHSSTTYLASVEIFWPAGEFFDPMDNLMLDVESSEHTAIDTGKNNVVMIVGGRNSRVVLNKIYFIRKNEQNDDIISPGPNMSVPRYGHEMIRTNHGDGIQVLIMGGFSELGERGAVSKYEIFDGINSMSGDFQHARGFFSATVLPNHDVILIGGKDEDGPVDVAEKLIYTQSTGYYASSIINSSMVIPRYLQNSILMKNKHILITGGITSNNGFLTTVEQAEIFNPLISK